MKQFLSVLILFLISTLVACNDPNTAKTESNNTKSESNDSTKIESTEEVYSPEIIKGKATKSLTAGETSETSSIYFEYFELNEKSPSYLATVNELVSKAVQSDFEEPKEEKITANLTKKYFADLLSDFKKDFLNVGEEYMPWSLMDSIHIDDSNANFVHLESYTYSFTGGAHGNGYEGHILLDKKTSKILSLSDVFNNVKKLNSLVDKHFRKSQGLNANESLEDAGWFIEGRLEANNNFYFTNKNVVFVYNSYEIGPYAAGAPTVEIPISQVKPLLKINLE